LQDYASNPLPAGISERIMSFVFPPETLTAAGESVSMPNPSVPTKDPMQPQERGQRAPAVSFPSDPAMARICIELFTRATLYAGAFGLIAGLIAALLFRE
jgi:hypothetical protein